MFVFDEPIQLNQIEKNLIINPFIDNPYKTVIKKNKLTLTFEDNFSPNTTYTLNFGQSIQDITEKNKTKNIKYIFSTGTYLDSLKVSTTIKYPLTDKPCKECLVSLYKTKDTNTIYKNNPAYFSYTDKQGKATIENISSDNYTIYALLDQNKNLTYDKGEKIAIHSSTIETNRKYKHRKTTIDK